MSDHIPIDMQSQIITRLPVKSVIRFASVSKQWKSLIHSPPFVNDFSLHRQQQKQLFVAERDATEPYRSFVDDDAFPQNKSILFVPESVNLLKDSKVVGSSHGLFCLLGSSVNPAYSYPKYSKDMAVVWNPAIRKSISIVVPNVLCDPCGSDARLASNFSFGVCPNTCDPKIVKINQKRPVHPRKLEDISCMNWQVEVFTLSSGVWRSPSGNLPHKWLDFFGTNIDQAVIDGSIYWIVNERISLKYCIKTLISFNLTSEDFKQVCLPDKLISCQNVSILIGKLRESLAIFQWKSHLVYKVWIMGNGASKSFTELFTIDGVCLAVYKQPVVRRNGQLIRIDTRTGLVVYEPCSNHFNDLGIYVDLRSFKRERDSLHLSSYTESLLLLDQSDTLTVRG